MDDDLAPLEQLLKSYEEYLLTLPLHLKRFRQRLRERPAAARAEAAVFGFLRAAGCEPLINEDPGTGGADFCCQKPMPFVVEVTSLDDSTLAGRAAMPMDIPDNGSGSYVDLPNVLNLIRTTISNKAQQLADYPCPRLLVICSEHWGTSVFFCQGGIKELLVGGSSISIPVGPEGATEPSRMTTELKDAVFLRIKDGVVEPCRRSISAILFIHLEPTACHALGALHPEPAIPFSIETFPKIPFARLRWPATEIRIEWLIVHASQARFAHQAINFTTQELREGVKVAPSGCVDASEDDPAPGRIG
jgi:hypothetical protein